MAVGTVARISLMLALFCSMAHGLGIRSSNESIVLLTSQFVVSLLQGTSCMDLKQPDLETPYHLCFDSLREVDNSGKLVASYSFPSLLWVNSLNFTSANATAMIANGAKISMVATISTSNGLPVVLGNSSFQIPANELFWRTAISAWPFQSNLNSLLFNWTLSNPSYRSWMQFNTNSPFSSLALQMSADGISNWLLTVFRSCLADNVVHEIGTVSWLQKGAEPNSTLLDLQLTFPSFNDNVQFIAATWMRTASTSIRFYLSVAGVCLALLLLGLSVGILLPHCILKRSYARIQ